MICGLRLASVSALSMLLQVEAEPVNSASCIFDALQGSTMLAQAGVAIDDSTRECVKEVTHDNKRNLAKCMVDIGSILKSFGYTSAFIASAANQCGIFAGQTANEMAHCVADVGSLLGAVGSLQNSGAGISVDCVPGGKGPYEKPNLDAPPKGSVPTEQTTKERDYTATTAHCAIDAMQSSWFIARAGLALSQAKSSCEEQKTNNQKAACSSTVSGVLNAFSAATSYISAAAGDCSHNVKTPGAMCADYIAMLTSGLTSVAAAGSSVSLSCKHEPAPAIMTGARRLQDGNYSQEEWEATIAAWTASQASDKQSPPVHV